MNAFQKTLLRIVTFFYPVKFHNTENIPDGAAVVVSNHFRSVDCAFLSLLFYKDSNFLAKKEIFKNKIIAKIARSYGAIPINRECPDMTSILQACKVLRRNEKLIVFPEGTRNKTKSTELLPLKAGSAVFAVKAKCPIVPVMQYKKSKFLVKSHYIIGKPFELNEFYDKKLSDDDIKKMDDILREKMVETHNEFSSLLKNKKTKEKRQVLNDNL